MGVTSKTFANTKKLQIIGCVLFPTDPADFGKWFPWIKFVVFNWQITTGTPPPPTPYARQMENIMFVSDHTFDFIPGLTVDKVKMIAPLISPYTFQREGLTKLTYMLQDKKFNEPLFKHLVNELKFDINEK